jgi:predicted nucleotidyltransferase
VGYFGSYARGDWGVGSDLDIVAIVSASDDAWDRRARSWDLSGLPVAADLMIS